MAQGMKRLDDFWRGFLLAWRNFRTAFWNGLPKADDLARFLLAGVQMVLILALTLFLAQRVKGWVARLLGRSRMDPNVIALAGNGVYLLFLLLGVSWLLGIFGANWTAVIASLSVVTVAVTLSLQDVLKNLVAGVYLLLERPFKIGDQVALKGVTGQVEGIDIRTTILRTDEGLQVLVPNTIVFTEVVVNRSAYDTRRVSLQLAAIQADFQDLNRLVTDALAPFEEIEHAPAPKVTIQKVEDGATSIGVEYWQRGTAPILPDVLARLKGAFPEADITVVASGIQLP